MPDQINPPEAPKSWDKKGLLSRIIPSSSDTLPKKGSYDPQEEKVRRELEHVDSLKRKIDLEMKERQSHLRSQDLEMKEKKEELDRIEADLRRREMMVAGPGGKHHISKEVTVKEKVMGAKEGHLKVLEEDLEESRKVLQGLEQELRSREELIRGKEEIAEKLKKDAFHKEREITRREELLRGKETKFQERISKVRELEDMYKSLNIKDLVTFDRLLQEKEGILDRKEIELRVEIHSGKEKESSLLRKESELNLREADLDSKTRDVERARQLFNARNLRMLAFKEKLIAEKEALLAKKEHEIIEIERRVKSQVHKEKELKEKEIAQKKKELELTADRKVVDEQLRRYHKIISERENLEAIHEKLKKKEDVLRRMDQGVRKRMEYYHEVVDKSPEIEERITFIMNKGKILDAMENELRTLALRIKEEREDSKRRIANAEITLQSASLLREKEHMLQQKEDILDALEAEMSAYSKDREELIEFIEMLNKEKVILQSEHDRFLDEMSKMKSERDFNWEEIKKALKVLETDRSHLSPIARQVEEDVRIISEKETEITKLVSSLERRQAFITKEEARVKDILQHAQDLEKQAKAREKNIKGLERSISKEESRLRSEIEKIDKAKRFKHEIPKLTRIYNKLRTDILKINEEALAKREGLKEFESRLTEKEHFLILKEKEMMAQTERIKHDEANWSRLERVADSEKIYREIKTVGRLGKDYVHSPKGDVYAMIENARTLIGSRQTDHAAELIEEIEKECGKADASERRLLSYEVLELKNDLKLASLA